jgi:diguanylate cyclase (GGDEF)-like protein
MDELSMSSYPTKLLLIESDPLDAALIQDAINSQNGLFHLIWINSLADSLTFLQAHPVDMILLEMSLPNDHQLTVYQQISMLVPSALILLLIATDDKQLIAQAMQDGAQDYIAKNQLDAHWLSRLLRYVIERKNMLQVVQHDCLTGLANRKLLAEHLGRAMRLAKRNKKQAALLFIDLDNFKHINDTLGHAVGDQLLQSVAKRFVKLVRITDTVCRQGGDEFVILLTEIEKRDDAVQVAEKLIAAFALPHQISGNQILITLSIGVSVYPDDGRDVATAFDHADRAMYHAKSNGRNNYQFFHADMKRVGSIQ